MLVEHNVIPMVPICFVRAGQTRAIGISEGGEYRVGKGKGRSDEGRGREFSGHERRREGQNKGTRGDDRRV